MASGRKAAPATRQLTVEMDTGAIARASAARDEITLIQHQAEENTRELAVRLGYDGPLEPELLRHGIVHGMRRSIDAFLDMGRMLLLLKERVGHGEFQNQVEQIGMPYRAAAKFMQAALKLANVPSTAHLTKAIGTQGKLIELLVLDDDEIKELSEKGSTLGISIDEIDSMSSKQLRAALREARGDLDAKDKLIETKNKKIDKLSTFKARPDALARTQDQAAQLEELHDATRSAELQLMRLAVVVSTIAGGDSKPMIGRANQAVQYLVSRLAEVIDQNGIDVSLAEQIEGMPEWLMPGSGN